MTCFLLFDSGTKTILTEVFSEDLEKPANECCRHVAFSYQELSSILYFPSSVRVLESTSQFPPITFGLNTFPCDLKPTKHYFCA